MLKHLMILSPGEKRNSIREEENLLPAAMEAEMQIDTSCDRMTTCEKCEIKPLITEPASPKHLINNAVLWKKRFLWDPSDWR